MSSSWMRRSTLTAGHPCGSICLLAVACLLWCSGEKSELECQVSVSSVGRGGRVGEGQSFPESQCKGTKQRLEGVAQETPMLIFFI